MIDIPIPDGQPTIAVAKLEWLQRQCKSPRPRLGSLTLTAMADLAMAVAAERMEQERQAVEGLDLEASAGLMRLTTLCLERLDGSIGGGA